MSRDIQDAIARQEQHLQYQRQREASLQAQLSETQAEIEQRVKKLDALHLSLSVIKEDDDLPF